MDKPFIIVLFGATGDLVQRKIMPALFRLFKDNKRLIARHFAIIAFSRRPWTDEEYRTFIRPALGEHNSPQVDEFLKHVTYSQGHFVEDTSYEKLVHAIKDQEIKIGKAHIFCYYAVKPEFFETITHNLARLKLFEDIHTKVFIEKPFGNDEASARDLESLFEQSLRKEQLLRVDHYLAKEGLETFIKLRRESQEIERKLNNQHVRSVTITIHETIGIEGRGEFYDRIGALRDVGQNHALEMLAVALMDIHEKDENKARAEALMSLRLVQDPLLGQYQGYTSEEDIRENSTTETYFKLKLESSLPHWKGVPIVVEAGKAMAERKANIEFLLHDGNVLTYDIQESKNRIDAYENLIEQAILEKKQYFASFEEIIAAWKLLDPILKKRDRLEVKSYSQHTNGPQV